MRRLISLLAIGCPWNGMNSQQACGDGSIPGQCRLVSGGTRWRKGLQIGILYLIISTQLNQWKNCQWIRHILPQYFQLVVWNWHSVFHIPEPWWSIIIVNPWHAISETAQFSKYFEEDYMKISDHLGRMVIPNEVTPGRFCDEAAAECQEPPTPSS